MCFLFVGSLTKRDAALCQDMRLDIAHPQRKPGETSANSFIAGFTGARSMNLVVEEVTDAGGALELGALELGGLGRLAISDLQGVVRSRSSPTEGYRRHDADIDPEGHQVSVLANEGLGHELLPCVCGADDQTLRVSPRGEHRFGGGQKVGLRIVTSRLHFCGPDGHRFARRVSRSP